MVRVEIKHKKIKLGFLSVCNRQGCGQGYLSVLDKGREITAKTLHLLCLSLWAIVHAATI